MRRLLQALLFSTGLLSSALSANTLIEVYELAFQSNPQLMAEAASRLATGERKNQASASFLPEINLSASTNRIWQDTSSERFDGRRNFNDRGYTLSLVQPLYRRENVLFSEQVDIAIEGADASFVLAEQTLLVRVTERYFDVLGRQDDLTFALAEREAIAKQLEQVEQRFEVGLATITDVTEAQAAFDIANAAVIVAENELINSRELLRETTGVYHELLASLQEDSPLVSPEPADIDQWTEVAITTNPALRVARSNVNIARNTIQVQRSGHHPSVDAVARKEYSFQSDSNISGSTRTHRELLGIQFNLPIYSGGAVTSRTREAGYRLDESMQNEEELRRLILRETRAAFNNVISGISRVQALKQAVVSNEKALESTQAGFEVGTRTTVDVLNARRELFSARRDYAQSRYDYIVNTLRLKQAAGIVTVDDLYQINQWLVH